MFRKYEKSASSATITRSTSESRVTPQTQPQRKNPVRRNGLLPLGGEIAIPPPDATLSESAAYPTWRPVSRGYGSVFSRGGQGPAVLSSQRFYAVSLSVVLSLTFLGWYLLLRDTLREARLAELRSQFVSSVSHEFKMSLILRLTCSPKRCKCMIRRIRKSTGNSSQYDSQ